jgi:hypothetical protein
MVEHPAASKHFGQLSKCLPASDLFSIPFLVIIRVADGKIFGEAYFYISEPRFQTQNCEIIF